jgi:mono/diheme cytochrome c family protein
MNRLQASILAPLTGVALMACEASDDETRRANLGLPSPDYVADPQRGAGSYATHCQGCHGPSVLGSALGPPLLHATYVPSHHADFAFYSAVKNGVLQHHWEFGDMPPLPHVPPEQVADITAYVRALQRKHGFQ